MHVRDTKRYWTLWLKKHIINKMHLIINKMHLILLLFYLNFGVIWSFEQSSGEIDSSFKSLDIEALCTNIDHPDYLMESAISLSHVLNRNIEQHHGDHMGPSILVAIVTFASTNIWNYASYSSAINVAFAEAQGYMIKIFDENTFDDKTNGGDSRWNKIKIMEDALDPSAGWARNVDYLVWVDADLIFLDLEFKLETIISTFSLNRNVNMFISAGICVFSLHYYYIYFLKYNCIPPCRTCWELHSNK